MGREAGGGGEIECGSHGKTMQIYMGFNSFDLSPYFIEKCLKRLLKLYSFVFRQDLSVVIAFYKHVLSFSLV